MDNINPATEQVDTDEQQPCKEQPEEQEEVHDDEEAEENADAEAALDASTIAAFIHGWHSSVLVETARVERYDDHLSTIQRCWRSFLSQRRIAVMQHQALQRHIE